MVSYLLRGVAPSLDIFILAVRRGSGGDRKATENNGIGISLGVSPLTHPFFVVTERRGSGATAKPPINE